MKSGPEMQIETPSQISAWFERMSRVDDFNDQAALTVADLINRRTNEANHNVRQLSKIPNRHPLSRNRRPTHSLRLSAAKISCDSISSK
jgi:hypothetical protein